VGTGFARIALAKAGIEAGLEPPSKTEEGRAKALPFSLQNMPYSGSKRLLS
jgi:hypothetical protein